MTINIIERTIEMTKKEAREISMGNSKKLNEFIELRKLFPDFDAVIKTPTKKRETYKGLDYGYMKAYIEKHDDEEKSIMKEFYSLRGFNEYGEKDASIEEHSFGEIRMWFLDTFPEIEAFNKKTNEKLNGIKTKRANERKISA